jgi:hypothetical protein
MPNSSGCLHAHPEDIQRVYQLLLGLGVQVRKNPFSGKNYPYSPQGLCSIELVGREGMCYSYITSSKKMCLP